MPDPVFSHQSWRCRARGRDATPWRRPRAAPQEIPALQTGSEGSRVMEGRRDQSQFRSNPCSAGSPLHHLVLADMGTAPASPEPQLALSPRPQPCCHAQQQRETPRTHHYLFQLHPYACVSQPWENQEKNGCVGGPREQISIYTGTSQSFKMLRALTPHGPGFRAQVIPRAICRECSTGATKDPP